MKKLLFLPLLFFLNTCSVKSLSSSDNTMITNDEAGIVILPEKNYYITGEPLFIKVGGFQAYAKMFLCRDGRAFPRREVFSNKIATNFSVPGQYTIGVYGIDSAGHAGHIHSIRFFISNTNAIMTKVFDFEDWRDGQCEGWTNGPEYHESAFENVQASRDSLFGNYAVKLTVSPNGAQAFWYRNAFPLNGGNVNINFFVKTVDLSPRVKIALKFFSGGHYLNSAESEVVLPVTNWESHRFVIPVTEGADHALVLIESYGTPFYYGTFLLDRLVLSVEEDKTPPVIINWSEPADNALISNGIVPIKLCVTDQTSALFLKGKLGEQPFCFPVTNGRPFSAFLKLSNYAQLTQTLKIWPEDTAGNVGITNTRTLIFALTDTIIAGFDFEDSTNTPANVYNGVTVSAIEASQASCYYLTGNTPSRLKSLAAKAWTKEGASFVFEVESPNEIELKSLEFDERASSTGPAHWRVELSQNGSLLWSAEGDTSGVFGTFPMHSLKFSGLKISGHFKIRWLGTGATSSRGSFRLDNIRLKGVVHVP